ncbi:MAG TPA: TonB-dependent receptor [Candidatus Acidoferrum sp.]|nr:TonB-dependent receptor [Candidatus Acidoferrum sp.]
MMWGATKLRGLNRAGCAGVPAKLLIVSLSVFLFAMNLLAGQTPDTMGQIQGTVFVQNSQGQSCIPNAKVILQASVAMETKTDEGGKFEFRDVPPGTYIIEAEAPGLVATQEVTIEVAKVAQFSLELKPTTVQDSVTVTAAASDSPATSPSPSGTVTASTLQHAPNIDDRAESILPTLPGVVRGPDGRINMKGARSTQSGALVNSVNATDPATGNPGIAVPIDVVASVQVISNPYDPQYGKLTGAVSNLDTKTGDFEKWHCSINNFVPRARVRDGTVFGIGAATPRTTCTGPLWRDHIAFTQSLEYRLVRTPVNSLPPFQRDTTLKSFNSYTQLDFNLTPKQTATLSAAVYPQKLQYLGLNTFTPQPSTSDYHQRGYQLYGQHRYLTGNESLLTSQFSYKTFDVDITPARSGPYQLLLETTEGGFFNSQKRRASRFDWEEMYQFAPRHFLGTHEWHVGLEYAHSNYSGLQSFSPVEIQGSNGTPIERITFTGGGEAYVSQQEVTWFAADRWTVSPRLLLDVGLRFDGDTVTSSAHVAPRLGFQLALTRSGRTMLRGGVGEFYDRVPLMIPAFQWFPDRTVFALNPAGQVTSSTAYTNQIIGNLRNPRSTAWNLALSQKVSSGLLLQVGYEQRTTAGDFVLSTVDTGASTGLITLSNSGGQSYKELQVSGRYQFHKHFINASYVRSRAYGDLNDFFQFFGNVAKPVIQPDEQGRLSFDAPNRFLFSGEIHAPWKLIFAPVFDLHTGFPYSVQNEFREYIGPRNTRRFPEFSSFDLQVSRPVSIPAGGDRRLKARVGLAAFNVFNHFNPRDVQTIEESARFGGFSNNAWREYRGKFVLEF